MLTLRIQIQIKDNKIFIFFLRGRYTRMCCPVLLTYIATNFRSENTFCEVSFNIILNLSNIKFKDKNII
jgi:hypothetical protein